MINSIGAANPATVGSVAKGLGLAIEETIKAVYRAPVILASKLERAVAEQLDMMLSGLGFETSIASDAELNPLPNPLYDVVLRLEKPEAIFEVAEQLGFFCGIGQAEAIRLITVPPGIILGGVSQATVDALAKRLKGLGTKLIQSRPQKARYDLFSHGLPETMARMLRSELKLEAGMVAGQADSIFANDLDYAEANRLWRKYGRSGHVTIIDRDFQCFDIILEEMGDGQEAEQADLLHRLFGIPEDIIPSLRGESEIILAGNRGYGEFEDVIAEMARNNIWARADLSTFAQRSVLISGMSEKMRPRYWAASALMPPLSVCRCSPPISRSKWPVQLKP
ncbi:MAG: hypothetical protein HC843_11475 [Sphingomonadales bacterium]|nr:hypothetical protein [Sphingomonadales bacterium]